MDHASERQPPLMKAKVGCSLLTRHSCGGFTIAGLVELHQVACRFPHLLKLSVVPGISELVEAAICPAIDGSDQFNTVMVCPLSTHTTLLAGQLQSDAAAPALGHRESWVGPETVVICKVQNRYQ